MMHEFIPALVCGLPADTGPLLDMLAQSWSDLERGAQRQSIADAFASGLRDDFVCARALYRESLAGVALAQRFAGRTAAIYPPQITDSSPPELAIRLLYAMEEQLRHAGVRLAQALLALDQVLEEQRFVAAGYARAATLLYMVGDAASLPSEARSLDLALEPVTPANAPRLHCVIEASYQGTLDCPLLNGLRTTADVLAGYRAVGTYRPELWLLARHGDHDIGCLLLADYPQLDNLELVYLGVIPAARGKRYGLALAQHALRLTRQLGRKRVVLAVDAANAPAIRLYEEAGFFGFDQRLVIIKQL